MRGRFPFLDEEGCHLAGAGIRPNLGFAGPSPNGLDRPNVLAFSPSGHPQSGGSTILFFKSAIVHACPCPPCENAGKPLVFGLSVSELLSPKHLAAKLAPFAALL